MAGNNQVWRKGDLLNLTMQSAMSTRSRYVYAFTPNCHSWKRQKFSASTIANRQYLSYSPIEKRQETQKFLTLTDSTSRTDSRTNQKSTNNFSKSYKRINENPNLSKTSTPKSQPSSIQLRTFWKISSNFCQNLLLKPKQLLLRKQQKTQHSTKPPKIETKPRCLLLGTSQSLLAPTKRVRSGLVTIILPFLDRRPMSSEKAPGELPKAALRTRYVSGAFMILYIYAMTWSLCST
jgi:hypothetical protein